MGTASHHRAGAGVDAGVGELLQKVVRFHIAVLAHLVGVDHHDGGVAGVQCFLDGIGHPFQVSGVGGGEAPFLLRGIHFLKQRPGKLGHPRRQGRDKTLFAVRFPQGVDGGCRSDFLEHFSVLRGYPIDTAETQRIEPGASRLSGGLFPRPCRILEGGADIKNCYPAASGIQYGGTGGFIEIASGSGSGKSIPVQKLLGLV